MSCLRGMIRGYTNLPFLIFQHAVRIPIPAQDANDIYFNSFWIRILSVEFSKSQNLYYEHWCDTKHIWFPLSEQWHSNNLGFHCQIDWIGRKSFKNQFKGWTLRNLDRRNTGHLGLTRHNLGGEWIFVKVCACDQRIRFQDKRASVVH